MAQNLPSDRVREKQVLRRRVWMPVLLTAAGVLILVFVLGQLSALRLESASTLMSIVLCLAPLVLLMLPLWLLLAALMYGVYRMDGIVGRQMATLEGRARDARVRATTAGRVLARATIRLTMGFDRVSRWFGAFEPRAPRPPVSEE
jgi:hypothetical protein